MSAVRLRRHTCCSLAREVPALPTAINGSHGDVVGGVRSELLEHDLVLLSSDLRLFESHESTLESFCVFGC